MEFIHKRKFQASREKFLEDQAEARRRKTKEARTRRAERIKQKKEVRINENEPHAFRYGPWCFLFFFVCLYLRL